MSYVRQSLRIRPPFGEEGDPALPPDGKIVYEEEFWPQTNQQLNNQQINQQLNNQQINQQSNDQQRQQEFNAQQFESEESFDQTDDKRLIKKRSKKELAHADFIERLLIVASSNKKRQRRSSTPTIDSSYYKDKLIQDENNNSIVEKLLEKFENIRSEKTNQYADYFSNDVDNQVVCGVERIVERRYYVKKSKLTPKHDQLTSTTDLTGNGKKNRQLSGVSTLTATTTECSQCSSSTPTYVENLQNQSNSLRNEISGLKGDIEQLQTSQQKFFRQLQTQFQSKTVVTPTAAQNPAQSVTSSVRSSTEKTKTFGNMTIPLKTGQRSRSISTESIASSSLPPSGASTPTQESTTKPILLPLTTPNASLPQISEFLAYKSPSITPIPLVNAYISAKSSSETSVSPVNAPQISSKPASIAPTPPVNSYVNSKPPSIARTPPVNAYVNSKPPSVARTSSVNGHVSSKSSPVASATPTTEFAATKKPSIPSIKSVSSRNSSTAPTPQVTQSPRSSARMPIYENELAHRRVLSPRSQIVASSLSTKDSSDASSRSTSPESVQSKPQKLAKIPEVTLRDNDLKELAQYSSNLEVSGFPPSRTAVINNPNTSSTFWESVDEFVEASRSANIVVGKPPIPPSNTGNKFGLYNNTSKQLDKYDLEIKPQEIIASSAPLLMPPLDILP